MKRLTAILSFITLLAVSCVENPDIGPEEKPVTDPELSIGYTLLGSYSVEFVCTVGETDRIFIGGGFLYSKTPGFEEAATAPGLVLSNELSCIVSDLEPDTHYYVKAFIYDVEGRLESAPIDFDSPSFKVTGNTDFHLTYQGGPVDLTVISNEDFMVYTDVDWITGVDTRAGETFNRSVVVQENPSLYARSATLTLASPDSYFRETVTVSQDGAPVRIPDAGFKAYLLATYDADGSSEIELAEIPSVTEIVLQSDDIRSLEGLDQFPNLEKLICRGLTSGQLESLDLSGSPRLSWLEVAHNNLTSLDLSGCPQLKTLDCSHNRLKALDLSGNGALEYLDAGYNELTELDLSGNHSLLTVRCEENRLTALRTPRSESFAELVCKGNQLETLDLSNNRGLRYLDCSENRFQALNLSANSALTWLDCSSNALTELSVWRNEALETLAFGDNQITSIDLSRNAQLKTLDCSGNLLKTLDLSANLKLESVDCERNPLPSLDVSMLPSLTELHCNCTGMLFLLTGVSQRIPGVTENRDEDHVHPDTAIHHPEDMADIADPTFLAYLVRYYDSDGDGLLSKMEADRVTSVSIDTDQVESLSGIEHLIGLKFLKCEGSWDGLGEPGGKLTSLDLSHNHLLEQVLCGWNRIERLDVSGCPKLKTLWCFGNRLRSLDVSACPELTDLNCEYNLLAGLDLTVNPALVSLDCSPMAGSGGVNLLQEVRIGPVRIDYVNGREKPRSSSCIPPRTTLYVDGTATSSITAPFMFNYNAKDFSAETSTLRNTPGALWEKDLVLNGTGFTVEDSHLHIEPGTYASVTFPSAGDNPFNRSGQDKLTLIAKVKGESATDYSVFSCRSESSGYCYMFREGSAGTDYFYLHDTRPYGAAPSLTVRSLPNIVGVRAEKGTLRLYSFTDNLKTSPQTVSWGKYTNTVSLFYGGAGEEFWKGDFYWIFLSLEALTDDEITQVIDYNEF